MNRWNVYRANTGNTIYQWKHEYTPLYIYMLYMCYIEGLYANNVSCEIRCVPLNERHIYIQISKRQTQVCTACWS